MEFIALGILMIILLLDSEVSKPCSLSREHLSLLIKEL